MKTKSTRKRLLVSSVAMLLVAMLALGTATYAWFTTDTTTQARGISVKTTKKSTLLVSSVNSPWTNNLNYAFSGEKLMPASSTDGVNWYYAQADSALSYSATSGKKVEDYKDTTNGYVYTNMLNVKNAGSVNVKDVKIEATLSETAANSTNYVRVALVPAKLNDGTLIYDENTNTDTRAGAIVNSQSDFLGNIYGLGTATPVSYVGTGKTDTTGAITKHSASVEAQGTAISKTITQLAPGESQYYMLFVWFEGQSEGCYDATAGNYISDLIFSVTGTPETT